MEDNKLFEQVKIVSPFLQDMKWKDVEGSCLVYNKLVSSIDERDWFEQENAGLTLFIGQVEVSSMDFDYKSPYATGPQSKKECISFQILSKLMGVGRAYLNAMVNGDQGAGGMVKLSDLASKTLVREQLDADVLDVLVKNKPDFILMNRSEFFELKSRGVLTNTKYKGVKIYFFDYINREPWGWFEKTWKWVADRVKFVKHRKYTCATMYSGRFDDGSMSKGLLGLKHKISPSIHDLGPSETKDVEIHRVKMYAGVAYFDDSLTMAKVRVK